MYNEDGFGSRIADNLMNESYYLGIDEPEEHENMKILSRSEENLIIKRIAQLMKGCGSKRSNNEAK